MLHEFVQDDAYNAIVIAPTHWRIRVRHNYAFCSPWSDLIGSSRVCVVQGLRVVYAAIERRIIVYRRYREGIDWLWRMTHVAGPWKTPGICSSHVEETLHGCQSTGLGNSLRGPKEGSLQVWG